MITFKRNFTWPDPFGRLEHDNRPIAAIHVAAQEGRSATNPAGWMADPAIDIADTAALRRRFAERMHQVIESMKAMNAQGGITWDLDGARFGTYLGLPSQALALNPELGSIADGFHAGIRAAGFKSGCAIRPAKLVDGTIVTAPLSEAYDILLREAAYARGRWKCRLIYVDSDVRAAQPPTVRNEWQWGPLLPAALFARLHKELPDVLWSVEHENEDHYFNSAVYAEVDDQVPPPWVKEYLPSAFAVININPILDRLDANRDRLIELVRAGNILLANAGLADSLSAQIGDIYRSAIQ